MTQFENGASTTPTYLDLASPPFVGRRDALTQFAACWQDALAGRPRVMLIAGEAGAGKTALLTECQTQARHHQSAVYAGRCYEGKFLPYAPFVEALHHLSATGVIALFRVIW